jgi:hypothetical protein
MKVCQICNKRPAYKRLVSNIDGSFILICKKKKCIEKVYEEMDPSTAANSLKEFVKMIKWNRDEYQGRSYMQVRESYKILDLIVLIVILSLIVIALYSVI